MKKIVGKGFCRNCYQRMNISLAIATIENLIELFDLKEEDF